VQLRAGAAAERQRDDPRLERVGVLGQVQRRLPEQRRLGRALHCAAGETNRRAHDGQARSGGVSNGGVGGGGRWRRGEGTHRVVDEELVDLVLAGGRELGGLVDRGGPLARAVGDLRALRPRRRPARVPRRHHHHHRLPSHLRHLRGVELQLEHRLRLPPAPAAAAPPRRLEHPDQSVSTKKKAQLARLCGAKLLLHRRPHCNASASARRRGIASCYSERRKDEEQDSEQVSEWVAH
jgi:hypothetical protein